VPNGLCTREEGQSVGLAVISLLILVVIAIIAIPILIRVFGEAARRNPNRPGGTDETEERNQSSGPG